MDLAVDRASVPFRSKRRPPSPCPCGGCGTRFGFCEEHRARLARVRAEIERELREGGRFSKRRDQRPDALGSTCCSPGCLNERDPLEMYCAGCRDELGEAA